MTTSPSVQFRIGSDRHLLEGDYLFEHTFDSITVTGVPRGSDVKKLNASDLVHLEIESEGVIKFDGDVSIRLLPTDTGKRKYPDDGLYEGIACTCQPDCPQACKGKCGCSACSAAYGDSISELGCD